MELAETLFQPFWGHRMKFWRMFDSGLISKNAKSSRKSPLAEVEAKLYEFLTEKLEWVYQLMGHCWLNKQKLFMREWTEWTENLKIHFKWFDTPYVFLKLLSI